MNGGAALAVLCEHLQHCAMAGGNCFQKARGGLPAKAQVAQLSSSPVAFKEKILVQELKICISTAVAPKQPPARLCKLHPSGSVKK